MSTDAPGGRDARELRRRLQPALSGRYALQGVLGSGAMGTVLSARDLKHDRVVALKVLPSELASGMGAERFLREIRIASGLAHPHIVPVFDSGEADGLLYFVMPRLEGESLRSLIEREGPLPVERAVTIAREIADALDHAHASGIVHRDVKPANILLVGGHALLADFGVARIREATSDTLTRTGAAVGTPAYMSPEQMSGDADLDARSDVYSLGCVLYEMLTGRRPFRGRSAAAILGGQLEGVSSVREERADVPAGLAATVRRALAPDPGDRFQSARALGEALAAGTQARTYRTTAAVLAGVVVLGALSAAVFGLPRLRDPPDLLDREGSVVVLPYGDAIVTGEEETLLVDLADELTRQLNRWDAVRAVPQVALAGVTFDLQIGDPVLRRLDDGLTTARTLGVETLLVLRARIRGDSADVTATRFDPGREEPVAVGRPLEARGPVADPYRLAAGIVHGLLGLEGSVDEVEELRRRSSNPEALLRYAEGLDLLERWRLAEAEDAFRTAVELDSTFAMAHHYLALDLYWQGSVEPRGLGRRGPEAARLSRAALRHAGDLPPRDRLHVEALNRFLEGDYPGARAGYRDLLVRDSTDVYAWLLQGIVEFRDPWLVEDPDGSFRARSNMNVAVRSFRETTRLSPGFHLGYGHLFDIADRVIGGSGVGQVEGLERPRDERVPPWGWAPDPGSLEPFGLAHLDSLVWLPDQRFKATPEALRRAGAMELLESSMRTLRRWAAYAPEESRPHAELATWTVRQRSLLQPPQPPERPDSLARAARAHAEEALALAADTLVSDLVLLANLHLATGDPDRARELVERAVALADEGDVAFLRGASNAFVHGGDARRALDLLDRNRARSFFWPDPDSGEMLGDGGVASVLRRIAVLAATGADAEELDGEFAELERRWAAPPEGTAPIRLLRTFYAHRIAPALAAAPDRLVHWRDEGDLADPFWAAVDPTTPDRLAAVRSAARPEHAPRGDPRVGDAEHAYVLGTAALEVGDPALALRLLARLDSVPLAVETRDVGWGLRSLARFRRGEAHEMLGDTARAVASFRSFLETRSPEGDPSTSPLTAAARGHLARLDRGG